MSSKVTVEDLKGYLRAEYGYEEELKYEDVLLKTLLGAAVKMIIGGTRKDVDQYDDRFKLASMMLAGHWYENRTIITPHRAELPFGVSELMMQLKHAPTQSEVGAT